MCGLCCVCVWGGGACVYIYHIMYQDRLPAIIEIVASCHVRRTAAAEARLRRAGLCIYLLVCTSGLAPGNIGGSQKATRWKRRGGLPDVHNTYNRHLVRQHRENMVPVISIYVKSNPHHCVQLRFMLHLLDRASGSFPLIHHLLLFLEAAYCAD